jgi:predicted Holliday junction resolvase-like endonuclease
MGAKRVMLIVVLVLFGVVYIQSQEIKKQANEKREAQSFTRSLTSEIERVVDEKGRETAKAEAAHISLETLKALDRSQYDELRREIGNMKRLLSHTKISTSTKGSVAAKIETIRDTVGTDTLPSFISTFAYNDQWLKLNGRITADSLIVSNYEVRNELSVTVVRKRDNRWKFWKPKKTYVTVVNSNPNTTTETLETIIVK